MDSSGVGLKYFPVVQMEFSFVQFFSEKMRGPEIKMRMFIKRSYFANIV